MTSASEHREKTLAEAYRRELDQEENVWRSLPFLAATVAFQLAALFQVMAHLPPPATLLWVETRCCLGISSVATLVALAFLAASIYPAKFRDISTASRLLLYAQAADRRERAQTRRRNPHPVDALNALRALLAREYADATNHNRPVNQRPSRCRSVPGLATLLSVLATILLVVMVIPAYIGPVG
jgi:hypothetical protein